MPGAGRDQSHKSLHDGTVVTDPPAATARWQTPTWVPQMVLSGLTAGELCGALVPGARAGMAVTLLCVPVMTLASCRRSCDRLTAAWPTLLAKREERLAQQQRFGTAVEKVAGNIPEGIFTMVLIGACRR